MSFKEIVGHEEAVSFLEAVFEGGRLAHAYLFAGPRGVGKAKTARAFAQLLLCEMPKGAAACGTCGSCRKAAAGQHPDLKVLEPDGEFIKIDAIREAGRFVGLRPFEGRRKALLIDPASAMNEESANALLKTLEEPVSQTTLLLIAEDARRLPPTIVSRCQRIAFGPLAPRQVEALLVKKLGLPADEAKGLSRLCDGSPGEALRFHEEDVLARRDALLRVLVSDEAIKEVQGVMGDREQALRLLRAVALWYRDLLAWKVSGAADLLMTPVTEEALRRATLDMTIGSILRALGAIAQTSLDIKSHANMRLAFEQMRTQLCIPSHR
jgi:DNA polymerase-3 subunit delta'